MCASAMSLSIAVDTPALRLFPVSDHDQSDPTDKHQSAQDGRERDGFLGVGGGLDRANIDHRLAACVSDALVSKRHYSEYDQNDPNQRYRIHTHRICSFVFKSKCLIHLIAPNTTRYRTNAIDPERHQSANQ